MNWQFKKEEDKQLRWCAKRHFVNESVALEVVLELEKSYPLAYASYYVKQDTLGDFVRYTPYIQFKEFADEAEFMLKEMK
jgi:hypothetical protein